MIDLAFSFIGDGREHAICILDTTQHRAFHGCNIDLYIHHTTSTI
jgi:hypothetical protein